MMRFITLIILIILTKLIELTHRRSLRICWRDLLTHTQTVLSYADGMMGSMNMMELEERDISSIVGNHFSCNESEAGCMLCK